MWKDWMSKKKTYTDDLAAQGTMYVVYLLRDARIPISLTYVATLLILPTFLHRCSCKNQIVPDRLNLELIGLVLLVLI
ncbi:hypothetical protein ACT4US_31460 [Bacillus sp. HC-Mk]